MIEFTRLEALYLLLILLKLRCSIVSFCSDGKQTTQNYYCVSLFLCLQAAFTASLVLLLSLSPSQGVLCVTFSVPPFLAHQFTKSFKLICHHSLVSETSFSSKGLINMRHSAKNLYSASHHIAEALVFQPFPLFNSFCKWRGTEQRFIFPLLFKCLLNSLES